jgi:hypothetical protein
MKTKYLGISTNRSGTTYFFNSLAKVTQTTYHDEPMWVRPNNIGLDGMRIANANLDQLIAESNWTCKCFVNHLEHIDQKKFINLMEDSNVFKIYMYRDDIEDTVLSMLVAQQTKTFHLDHENSVRKHHIFEYNTPGIVRSMIVNACLMILTYHRFEWDHIVQYETLSGIPYRDFQFLNLPIPKHLRPSRYKIADKESKKLLITNYSDFKNDFDRCCKQYNISSMLSQNL